ncbi:divalent-cation tolerance protein CutA [Candidatus Woesearchaeota archaeon]|nr:divalent-cation tolerance protein CutA [Candidatus Woesearchaeota archaeon]
MAKSIKDGKIMLAFMITAYVTFGSKKEAEKIALALLKKRLIACANIFPVDSRYWQNGKIESQQEYAMLAKSQKRHFERIKALVQAMHSYEVPCVVCYDISGASASYSGWVREETSGH